MGNSKSKADTWGGREPEKVEAPEGGVEVEPVDLETIRADNLKNKKQDDKISKVWLKNLKFLYNKSSIATNNSPGLAILWKMRY